MTPDASRTRLRVFAVLRRVTLALRAGLARVGLLPLWVRLYEPLRRPLYARLKPEGELRLDAHGLTWRLDATDEVVARNLLTYGAWEPEETTVFLGLLRPGMTVADIGANFGYHTLQAARKVGPQGRVVAFEPAPRNIELLRQHLTINAITNVTVVPAAVSDVVGERTLYQSTDNFGAHSLAARNVNSDEYRPVPVQETSIDAWCAAHGIDGFDVVKMDAQGAEGFILRGGRDTFARRRDVVMVLEFWPFGLESLRTSPETVLEELRSQGFHLQYLAGRRLVDVTDDRATVRLAQSRDFLTLVARRR